jgi:hypothetical protein
MLLDVPVVPNEPGEPRTQVLARKGGKGEHRPQAFYVDVRTHLRDEVVGLID